MSNSNPKTVYENPWFSVLKEDNYHYIAENGSDNGAVIIPIIEDQFLLVSNYRIPQKGASLEFPRGYGEPGESLYDTAVRELEEETGYRVAPEKLEHIGNIRPNSAILTSKIPVLLCRLDTRQNCAPIDSEISEVVYLSRDALQSTITSGKVDDGITLAALALLTAREGSL